MEGQAIAPAKRAHSPEDEGPSSPADGPSQTSQKKLKTTDSSDSVQTSGSAAAFASASTVDTEMAEAVDEVDDGEVANDAEIEGAARPCIKLFNLPKCGNKEIRKFFITLGLDDTVKIKKDPKRNHCLLTCQVRAPLELCFASLF